MVAFLVVIILENLRKEGMYMKKKLLFLLTAGMIALSPTSACADEKDDRIVELESQVEELKLQIADLEDQLEKMNSNPTESTNQDSYAIGETWVVEGLLKLTINSVEEVQERNAYEERQPGAVYLVTYTYENLGKIDDMYISLDESIIDSDKKMGYSYPGDITMYPQPVPSGAYCEAQVCIGVDNPGNFTLRHIEYDNDYNECVALFDIDVE